MTPARKQVKKPGKLMERLTEKYEKAVIETAVETERAGEIVAKKTKKTVKQLNEKI